MTDRQLDVFRNACHECLRHLQTNWRAHAKDFLTPSLSTSQREQMTAPNAFSWTPGVFTISGIVFAIHHYPPTGLSLTQLQKRVLEFNPSLAVDLLSTDLSSTKSIVYSPAVPTIVNTNPQRFQLRQEGEPSLVIKPQREPRSCVQKTSILVVFLLLLFVLGVILLFSLHQEDRFAAWVDSISKARRP